MNLFPELKRQQRGTPFQSCGEMRYFLENCGVLMELGYFSRFKRASDPFDIIRANIIIRSIKNKEAIELAFVNHQRSAKSDQLPLELFLKEFTKDLPYYQTNDKEKIYVPILSRALNKIYSGDYSKLGDKNYRALLKNYEALVVDPFDQFGDALFDSYFSNLICLRKTEESSAYFSYDSLSVYFVNKQGRLDVELCLFDKGIKRRVLNHIPERLEPVLDAYYENDRDKFVKALFDNQFISSRFLVKYYFDKN